MTKAAQVFIKEIGSSKEIVNRAAVIRLRAERRLGELLEDMPKNKGAKGSIVTGSKREPVKDDIPTLKELGIDKKLSSRAQTLAKVSPERFEEALKAKPDREIVASKVIAELKRECVTESKPIVPSDDDPCCTITDLHTLIQKGNRFGCIYADPPWQEDHQQVLACGWAGFLSPAWSPQKVKKTFLSTIASEFGALVPADTQRA